MSNVSTTVAVGGSTYSRSGRRSSAYGFLYEFLATADYFLRCLCANDIYLAGMALLVGPTPGEPYRQRRARHAYLIETRDAAGCSEYPES
jgi:hypothetical protein